MEPAVLNLQQSKPSPATNRKARRAVRKARKDTGQRRTSAGEGAGPASRDRGMETARKHREAGRLQEAECCYRQVIEAEPECAEAYFQLGILFKENQQSDDAYHIFKRAVSIKNGNPAYWLGLGCCLKEMGQSSTAVIALSRVVALLPEDCGALIELGWALYADDKAAEALAVFDKAIQIKPDAWQAHYGKAQQHQALGQAAPARQSYLRVLELNPGCAVAYSRLMGLVS